MPAAAVGDEQKVTTTNAQVVTVAGGAVLFVATASWIATFPVTVDL